MESSNNLATIVKIKELRPIPDADKIEWALMEDNLWKCVVKKGEFTPGQLAVYFCIDSIVDSTNPALEFMAARKNRVWPCKFKKQISQGLLIPVESLHYWIKQCNYNLPFEQGQDVTELTKTTKYTREEQLINNPEAAGVFPTHIISKTDELNLLSYQKALDEYKGKLVDITLKKDGSSGTFLYKDDVFYACSRSQILKSESNNAWNRVAQKYNLAKILERHKNLIIQGEVCGPKLNGNKLGLKEEDLFIFDIFDAEKRVYWDYLQVQEFCSINNLKCVSLVWAGEFQFTIEELLNLAETQIYKSNNSPAEGIVIRARGNIYSDNLDKRLSTKIINPLYAIKNG